MTDTANSIYTYLACGAAQITDHLQAVITVPASVAPTTEITPTLQTTSQTTSQSHPPSTTSPSANASSSPDTGAIVGGVIGGVATIGLFVLATIFLLKRRRSVDGTAEGERGADGDAPVDMSGRKGNDSPTVNPWGDRNGLAELQGST